MGSDQIFNLMTKALYFSHQLDLTLSQFELVNALNFCVFLN